MERDRLTLGDRVRDLKPKHWALIGGGILVVLIMLASVGGSGIDPNNWNCENIKDAVVDSSRDRDVKILEIGEVTFEDKSRSSLRCEAHAEWGEGYGNIEYGAHVSEGGDVIVEYRQQ